MRAEATLIAILAAACGGKSPAARTGEAKAAAHHTALPPPFVVARAELLTASRDQTHLWWITRDAILRRPLGGPDAGAVERIDYAVGDALVAFASDRGKAYVCTATEVLVIGLDGKADHLADVSGAADIAVDEGVVYVADYEGVLRLAPGGATERVIGGTPVSGLVIADQHLYYVTGGQVEKAGLDGKVVERYPLGGTWISADERGIAMRTQSGDVMMRDPGGQVRIAAWPDGPWRIGAGAVVVGGDWLYVEAADEGGGASAILALPRDAGLKVVLTTGSSYVPDLAARGGELFWLTDESIVKGDPASGKRSPIAPNQNRSDQLELGRKVIYVAGYNEVDRIDPKTGRRQTIDTSGRALGTSGDVAAWLYGGTVRVWRKGKRYDVAQLGSYASNAPIVIDDDYLYVASGPIYRIDETGQVDLVNDGLGNASRLSVTAGDGGLYVLTSTGVFVIADGAEATEVFAAPGGEQLLGLFASGGWTYAISDTYRVYRIDPGGPDPMVLRLGSWGPIASDTESVYAVVTSASAIVRLPHDAPAVPVLQ